MLAGCALLSAYATKPLLRPIEVHTQTVEVQVRAPCPTPDERARLKQFRPAPLAGTPIPATVRERADKTVAQLDRCKGPGGWADQIDAALD